LEDRDTYVPESFGWRFESAKFAQGDNAALNISARSELANDRRKHFDMMPVVRNQEINFAFCHTIPMPQAS
jgi:hypothetical protein